MYGVLGEDKSDVETLKVLIKRLAKNEKLTIKTKGYRGCGDLLKKGGQQLKLFKNLGCHRFIVCYDADCEKPAKRYQEVVEYIIKPSGFKKEAIICIIIPVQEIEAWILADIKAVTQIFKNWQPKLISHPESIHKPKEHLERLSHYAQSKPTYNHATHNNKIAQYLNLEKVKEKCPSFRDLVDLVTLGVNNYPKKI